MVRKTLSTALAASVAGILGFSTHAAQAQPQVIWERENVSDVETRAVKWSPTGDVIAVGSGRLSVSAGHQAELSFWTSTDGLQINAVQQHENIRIARLNALAFHPDGQTIVTGEGQGPSSTWAINGRSAEFTVPGGQRLQFYPVQSSAVWEVAVSPDGSLIARGQWDNEFLQIVHFGTGVVTHEWFAHERGVVGVAFSPDGELVATGGRDGWTRVWRLDDGALLAELENPFDDMSNVGVNSVAFSPDGTMIAASYEGWEQGTAVWLLEDGELLHAVPGPYYQIPRIMFTRDSRNLIVGSRAWDQGEPWVGHIHFVELATGNIRFAWRFDEGTPNNGITDLDLSPDGSRIVFVQRDGVLTVADNPVRLTVTNPDRDAFRRDQRMPR